MNQQIPSLSQGLHRTDHVENQQSLPEGMSEREKIQYDYGRQRDMSKVTYFPAKKAPGLNDLTGRLRVVVYCRVSTDGLSQATSFELQKSYYLQFVRKHIQWKLIAMYSDEGITATSTEKRIGLLQMLEDAKAGKFDVIIVKNLSRLSRNLMDCMNIIYALRNLPNPVGIFFESERFFLSLRRRRATRSRRPCLRLTTCGSPRDSTLFRIFSGIGRPGKTRSLLMWRRQRPYS